MRGLVACLLPYAPAEGLILEKTENGWRANVPEEVLTNIDWFEVARREAELTIQKANPHTPAPIEAMAKVALGRASDEERKLVEDYFRQEEERQMQLKQLQEHLARCKCISEINSVMAQVEGWQLLPENPVLETIEAPQKANVEQTLEQSREERIQELTAVKRAAGQGEG